MAPVFPTVGKVFMLDIIFGTKGKPDNFQARLFTNNITPSVNTSISDLTEPGGTYSPFEILAADWTFGSVTDPPNVTLPRIEYTITGWNGNIYGFFITMTHGGVERIVSIERFQTPAVIDGAFISFGVIPVITLND